MDLGRRALPSLAVIGTCLGVYAVLAVGFRWFVAPSIANSPPAVALQNANAPPANPMPPPAPFAKRQMLAPAATAARDAPQEPKAAAKTPAPRRHVVRERSYRNQWDFGSARSYGNRSWF